MRRIIFVLCILMLCCCSGTARVKQYKVKVVREYAHDTGAYTQGLFFDGDQLCESTGQYGQSSYRKVDLESGKVLEKMDFGRKYFGEGSAILDGKLYILTWTNNVIFVYDPMTLKYEKSFSYPREGWGLTTDGKSLIASDGSSHIYFLSGDIKLQKTLNVTLDGRPVRYLNELEWINGRIWANVYTTDIIVIINPESGKVEGRIDCRGLLPSFMRAPETDVLNGIAVNGDRIFLTGKYWPRLYEVKLVEN